jgi:transcriptional regulator with GAF, ATPase, and Fis domain
VHIEPTSALWPPLIADIAKMVARNEFPSDLYYRLNVFPVLIPPMRERRHAMILTTL